ncbi:MAG: hypothetical protein HFI57_06920 [Lachnospiraceae bacterium]|nr:hypothetical protein [Lachnospiraceae bacterium]
MRKFQKQQLMEVIGSLHEIHQSSAAGLAAGSYQTVRNLLTDCQEAAIQVGKIIEQWEGEGTDAVACLEQYCETVYRVAVQAEKLSFTKAYASLEEVLTKAENAIRHMPEKKEIVFMPYKASMWDSLESVYLAAREDENCDAYVVPIPYFDKSQDDSFGEMHYEGNEYPPDIEITYYEDYDLEERRPDAIYIHNPYDEYNIVTSVPEQYYCSNLKRYTDCLVYIPYFILDEIEPDNQEAIENIKHFCLLPGVIWADKVIVQSENMRQIYINEFIKAAKAGGMQDRGIDRKILEEKFLGLGSPKFDRVNKTAKADMDLPDKWLRLIRKTDDTWKKVILYNTSVGAFLDHDEKMLLKMQSVFAAFKEQREKAVLWWRPHPLMSSTIKTMRPWLWEKYENLVRVYQEEGWGIYDDSADLDRAVVFSDAYYGDRSSVVQLYQTTGKPVMIQDAEVIQG